jgi:hypothetical protein
MGAWERTGISGCQVSEAPEPAGGAAFIPARSCDGPPRN